MAGYGAVGQLFYSDSSSQQQQPPWREQLTARGLVAAALIGSMYTVVVMKLNLTTGFVPTMNVSAALLAFLALRGWTGALARLGVAGARPFTRQENTVVQTCAVACYSLALCGTCQTPDSSAQLARLRRVVHLPCHGARLARAWMRVASLRSLVRGARARVIALGHVS